MAQQKRVAIPLTDLPSRTLEQTLAERDYVLVCHGLQALAVYRVKRDGLHRLQKGPKNLICGHRPENSLSTPRCCCSEVVSYFLRIPHHDASGPVPEGQGREEP